MGASSNGHELFIAFGPRWFASRIASLLFLYLFELANLLCLPSRQFHLIQWRAPPTPGAFLPRPIQPHAASGRYPDLSQDAGLARSKGSAGVESNAKVVDQRMGSCALFVVAASRMMKNPCESIALEHSPASRAVSLASMPVRALNRRGPRRTDSRQPFGTKKCAAISSDTVKAVPARVEDLVPPERFQAPSLVFGDAVFMASTATSNHKLSQLAVADRKFLRPSETT